jgi:hypothetical protein
LRNKLQYSINLMLIEHKLKFWDKLSQNNNPNNHLS